jgi:hypothetical protein
MRSLAWKLSIQLGYVMLNSNREMNVMYPLEIAKDALGAISQLSPKAFEVHGPGMEVKLYEIVSALADSISCTPEEQSSLSVGRRDTLRSLAGFMFSQRVMNLDLREKLSSKLDLILGGSRLPPAIEVEANESSEYDEDRYSPSFFLQDLDEFPILYEYPLPDLPYAEV